MKSGKTRLKHTLSFGSETVTGQECANERDGEGNGEHRLHLNRL